MSDLMVRSTGASQPVMVTDPAPEAERARRIELLVRSLQCAIVAKRSFHDGRWNRKKRQHVSKPASGSRRDAT
jgi:hypothetical protein